ncbi:MAG: 50S ribosomal protein L11 methyltransferase [Paludibacteraceae bacterium]|nr:50S ribosomal protein L11 methyltransferase [Paludibacteraceae bacterium]
MQYSESVFRISATESFVRDVLVAGLADLGYETFVDNDDRTLTAFIQTALLSGTLLDEYLQSFPFEGVTLVRTTLCEDKDWNQEWERNSFQPIRIGDECLIHAPFHKDLPQCRYDIIINPRMAFGTGTHQTTSLILGELLQMDLVGKALLDMGCGTAVLAILAAKRGAKPVTAIDIDNWCTENAAENARLNGITGMEILLGDARLLEGRRFDVILANINRNILLMDMPLYAAALSQGGTLLMSGFYTEDIPTLTEKAAQLGLYPTAQRCKDNWTMLRLQKD